MAHLVLLAGLALLVLGLWLVLLVGRPVDRRRVERFVRRHDLPLTDDNGPVVVRALAVSHRWRRFGLASGFLVAAVWSLREGRLQVDFLAMFLGWFLGAVVAEWRIAGPPVEGPRRSVDLAPRTVAGFVTGTVRAAFLAVLGLTAGAGLVVGVLALAGRVPDLATWLVPVVELVAGAVVVGLTARRVVDRPRPVASADVRAADDALRGHGLTVLAGSAIALAGLPLADFVSTSLGVVLEREDELASFVGVLVLLACVVLGWFVAARSRPARASRPAPAGRSGGAVGVR